MNLLEMDIGDYVSDIIDAFVEVAGEEYRSIIKERFGRAYLLPYNTLSHMEKYLDRLKQYKKKELAILFFEAIGVDVRKKKSKRYTDDLDEDFSSFIDNYFGGFTWMFKKNNCNGIAAWIEGDDDHKTFFIKVS